MSTIKSFKTGSQIIALQQDHLVIGQTVFHGVHSISTADKGMLEITGNTDQHKDFRLSDIEENLFLKNLSVERKKHPNQFILSQCLGLTQLAIAETLLNVENGKALVKFHESVNALERSMEQAPSVASTSTHLMLCYCYLEELMVNFGTETAEDFGELINDLLIELPAETLKQTANACASRGERFFESQLASLGFNFFKQELFICRQLQLINPENQELWQKLENTGKQLSQRCHQKGWENIALQIEQSINQWKSEAESTSDSEEPDIRLAELAEFERVGRAYLSHNDIQSARVPFEEHTALLKAIYSDYPLDYFYGKLLIESYEQLIDIYHRLGQLQQIDGILQEMVSHIQSLRGQHTNDEFFCNVLASCYEGLAERRREQNKLDEAITLYQNSLVLSELLESIETNFDHYLHYQLETLTKLIALTEKTGKTVKTAEFIKKADVLKSRLKN